MQSTLYFKYGNIYREVMKVPKTDLCEISKSSMQDNILNYQINLLMSRNDKKTPVYHECPYNVGKIHDKVYKSLLTFFFKGIHNEELHFANVFTSISFSNWQLQIHGILHSR